MEHAGQQWQCRLHRDIIGESAGNGSDCGLVESNNITADNKVTYLNYDSTINSSILKVIQRLNSTVKLWTRNRNTFAVDSGCGRSSKSFASIAVNSRRLTRSCQSSISTLILSAPWIAKLRAKRWKKTATRWLRFFQPAKYSWLSELN